MSVILKDDLIKACADAYRTASGTQSGVKAGELAELIASLSSGGGERFYIGQYTPTQDMESLDVVHGLGTEDLLLAAVFAESFEGIELSENAASVQVLLKTDYPQYISTAQGSFDNNFLSNGYYLPSNKYARIGSVTRSSEPVIVDGNTVRFVLAGAVSNIYRAGVTYTAIIVPFSIKEVLK